MKRIHFATLGLTLAAASIAAPVLAQSPAGQAQFSPPPPVYTPSATSSATAAPDASAATQAPATTDTTGASIAPAYTTQEAPAPVVEESSAAPQPMELAPPAPLEGAGPGDTRRAAPEAPPPAARHDPNAKTGPFLGHGLFDNWGPNDFGA
jgi:hypothetical protein